MIIEENQMIARSLLTFGLHVHVGIKDPERAIQIMNAIRYSVPDVLALSTSSPFWLGVHTGLKSYRSEVFTRFPRTGIPDQFDSGRRPASSLAGDKRRQSCRGPLD
jgi:carboxylate-amine ligase